MAKIDRFKLLDVSQRIHLQYIVQSPLIETDHLPRVIKCQTYAKRVQGAGGEIAVVRDVTDNRYFYSGLQTCGSVWACPVCASKIAQGRADEIGRALDNYSTLFPESTQLMLSLTVPHVRSDSFIDVRDRISRGLRGMRGARSKVRTTWGDVLERFQGDGTITCFEPLWSELNGWHNHAHMLLCVRGSLSDADIQWIHDVLTSEWIRYAGKGLSKKQRADMVRHSLKISRVKTWNDYLGKLHQQHASDEQIKACADAVSQSWRVQHEIALSHIKKGRSGSLSPFDMLRVIAQSTGPDSQKIFNFYGALFAEYADAQKGKRQIYFSKNFKEFLGIAEKSDDQIIDEQETKEMKNTEVVAVIDRKTWHEILSEGWRGTILDLLNEGKADSFQEALDHCRANRFKRKHQKMRKAG